MGSERPARQESHARAGDRAKSGPVPPSVLTTLASQGRPLDSAARRAMEKTFGRDFGRVRTHDSLESQSSAREVGAAAYTFGNHIALGKGVSDRRPASFPTLAHELIHVLQQGGTAPSPSRLDGALDVEQERQATEVGRTWSPFAEAPELLEGRPAVMRVPEAEASAAAVAPREEKTPTLGAGSQQWYHEHWPFPPGAGPASRSSHFRGFRI